MALIQTAGTDDVGNDFPWFWKTWITCPRCGCVFRLSHEDTLPGVVGPIGTLNTLWLGWRQVVEGDPLTAAIDLANFHVDPAQVYGACPYCGFNPIVVRGPRYGLTKTTLSVDPTAGIVQTFVNGGATKVSFVRTTDGVLVGLFFLSTGVIYAVDSSGLYASSIRRTGTNTLDAASAYLLATPSTPIPPASAVLDDPTLYTFLLRMGLTII